MIRVALPFHLRNLAKAGSEVVLEVSGEPTIDSVIDALERKYPMLAGTVREHGTGKRRAFLRFYMCGEDYSHVSTTERLPDKVVRGEEPFMVVGAMSGG